MLYTWRLWTRFKVNTFFFSLCIENHISRQDRWDERRNFFHWQRKRFSYSGINHTFQPSKSQSLKQFWKINHVLLGFVFLSVVNLKKKYVKKTVNSRNNFSHKYRKNNIIQASYSDHFKTIKSIIEKILDIGKLTVRWRVLLENNNNKKHSTLLEREPKNIIG